MRTDALSRVAQAQVAGNGLCQTWDAHSGQEAVPAAASLGHRSGWHATHHVAGHSEWVTHAHRERTLRGGERTAMGMVFLGGEVSPEDSENVRAYVIHRAHETQKLQAASVAAAPARDAPAGGPK